MATHFLAVFSIGLYLYQLRPVSENFGHDYYYHISKLLIGLDHFVQNGFFSLPHFTARVGGGLPQFADPQNIYFSVAQWLSFVMDPMLATFIEIALFLWLGYLGFYFLLREECGAKSRLPALAGLMFIWNGFGFGHFFVGHITHHGFFLIPWLLWVALSHRISFVFRTSFTVVLLAYLYLSGSKHVMLVALFSCFLFLPMLIQRRGREAFRYLGAVGLLFVLVTSGKMLAEWRYSEHFIRHSLILPEVGFLRVVTHYFLHWPWLSDHVTMGTAHIGSWEFVGYLSILGFFGLVLLLKQWREVSLTTTGFSLLICGVIGALAYGDLWNHHLPILRHYHLPIKLFAAFIPFFIFWGVKGLALIEKRGFLISVFACFIVAEGFVSSQYFQKQHWARGFTYDANVSRQVAQGALPPVTRITDNRRSDIVQLPFGQSSLRVYEPLFGYHRQSMRHQLVSGEMRVTHPGCLLYGRELGCQPWSTLAFDESIEFRSAKAMPQWVPAWQRNLLYANGLWFVFIIVGLLKGLQWQKAAGWRGWLHQMRVPVPPTA